MTDHNHNDTRRTQNAVPSRSLPRRLFRRGCVLLAWFVTVSLLAVATMRIVYHDGAFPLIWLNAFTQYVYLPAYVCAAWAAWQRRWPLTVLSGIVVVCHLVWIAPDFLPARYFEASGASSRPEQLDASPTIKIFFANVKEDNEQYQSMLQEIAEADPDVVMLVEYGWGWHLAFRDSPVMSPYKFGSGHMQSHIGLVNVFSRLPLKAELQEWIGGRAMQTIDIAAGSQTIRIVGLHAPRPMNLARYSYREFWQQMIPRLLATQGPAVIVGDFNATQHSLVYEQLTAEHFRSAHEDRGRGYAATWPNGRYWLPPIRIDQVLVTPEIECLSIAEGRGRGSDHKPLIVEVRVRGHTSGEKVLSDR